MLPSRIVRFKGFTIIELLVAIAIIAILASVVLGRITDARDGAFFSRAQAELREFATALEQYEIEERTYPANSSRGVVPAELTAYLNESSFSEGPWSGSDYAWDYWEIDGESVAQFTLRFCPDGATETSDCNFPNQDWAEDFGIHSSVFYCIEGACRASESHPRDYPGQCVNCDCREMAVCHGIDEE